ncbi:MAG: PriCT-2 domain-containing protein [Betaproteobacteria bacterium]|nr:PriCT-2 domain-containing protein [Betaproteobacteria bacterium]
MPAAVRLPDGFDDRPRIEVALRHLPADDRALWLRIGMAIKAGMGEDGFDLWDDWSRSSARYRDTDARRAWRSIRPDGGISLATLFFEAEARLRPEPFGEGRSTRRRAGSVRSPPPGGGG